MSGVEQQSFSQSRFSTRGMAPEESFDQWRSTVSQIHDLEPEGRGEGFEADVTAWSLGPLAIAGGQFSARRMVRDAHLTRRLQLDHYRILLPLGETVLQHTAGDQRQVVSAGRVVFSDLSLPEVAECSRGHLMQFIISRDVLDGMLPGPPSVHGRVTDGPMGALVTDHLAAVTRSLPALTGEQAQALVMPTLHLIAALMRPDAETVSEARPAIQMAHRRRILRFIDAELLSPGLGSETICARFGLSRAALYRLMQPLGGVAACVQERRLRRLRAELSSPSPHHLGQLSWKYGFSSQAQMSRAFRAQFGHPPKETPVDATLPSLAPGAVGSDLSFSRILRNLEG